MFLQFINNTFTLIFIYVMWRQIWPHCKWRYCRQKNKRFHYAFIQLSPHNDMGYKNLKTGRGVFEINVKTVVKSSIHPFSAIYLDLIYEDTNLSRCPDLAFPNHPLHLIPSQLRHIISPACTWALAGRTVCEPAYLEAIQEICLLYTTLTGIQQLMISVTTKSLWQ